MTFRSGRCVVCAEHARLVLAGGPGYFRAEDSLALFPVLGESGPEGIALVEPLGKMALVDVSARQVHTLLVNGVWFLS